MKLRLPACKLLALVTVFQLHAWGGDSLVYSPTAAKANGKNIVLLAGDEEYRSEESMPMLGRLLAERHGFKCTVLFSISPADGVINPLATTNIPGLDALERADLCIMALRFRELPDEQMRHIVQYVKRGRPLIGLRTSTHAFAYSKDSQSSFVDWDWRSSKWPGGFGQQVLGETWVSHHGDHGKQSTRSVVNVEHRHHPILRGVDEIWGPTDVYAVAHLSPEATVLLRGEVLSGMEPDSAPVQGSKNNPMMPLAWLKPYQAPGGAKGLAFTTTMGAAVDFKSEGLRRLIVNACYFLVGLDERIPPRADVRTIETYEPSYFGFGKFKPGLKPSAHRQQVEMN